MRSSDESRIPLAMPAVHRQLEARWEVHVRFWLIASVLCDLFWHLRSNTFGARWNEKDKFQLVDSCLNAMMVLKSWITMFKISKNDDTRVFDISVSKLCCFKWVLSLNLVVSVSFWIYFWITFSLGSSQRYFSIHIFLYQFKLVFVFFQNLMTYWMSILNLKKLGILKDKV